VYRLRIDRLILMLAIVLTSLMATQATDASVSAKIASVNSVPNGNIPVVQPLLSPGVTYTITNTGTEAASFYMGYSVKPSNSYSWPSWGDGEFKQTSRLNPGQSTTKTLVWWPPSNVQKGTYDVTIAVWKGKEWLGNKLQGELDRKTFTRSFTLI
jgi:hypothetical protein